MARKSSSIDRFWHELERRKVVRSFTVYASAAFVFLQLVDIVAEPLRLPVSTKALVIGLLNIGFLIATFLSRAYDIVPAGLKKTKPISAFKHIDQTTTPFSSRWKVATYIIAVRIVTMLLAFNFIVRKNLNTDISRLDKSIAVLPYNNLSIDPDFYNLRSEPRFQRLIEEIRLSEYSKKE